MTSPRCSVALCTRDGGRFLAQQLESILGGDRVPDEIVVSDDASTDDTIPVIESFVARAKSLGCSMALIANDPPLGVTKNFEKAIMATSGEIVLLSDQDDVWHPHKLAAMLEEFERDSELLLLHTDARLIDHDGRPLGSTLFHALGVSADDLALIHDGAASRALIRRNLATGATMAFRRALITWAAPFPEAWVHDEWLAIVASLLGRIDAVERPLIDYRQHGGNQIGVAPPTLRYRIRRMLEPRGDRNRRLAERSAVLEHRLSGALDEAGAAMLRGKAEFEAARARLPRMRIRRLVPVVRLAGRGGYRRFASQGALDAFRDLFQPA